MKPASSRPSPPPHPDQAAGLREMLANRPTQVIAFAGGGKATGRTTLAVQTAISLARSRYRVILVDENSGPASAMGSLEIEDTGDLVDALIAGTPLEKIIWKVGPNLWIASAKRTAALLSVDSPKAMEIAATLMAPLESAANFVLIDSLVLDSGQLSLLSAQAHHMVVVVSATPDAITSAYTVIKRLVKERGRDGFHLAITHAHSHMEAATIYDNVRKTAQRYLKVRVDFLGSLPFPLPDNLSDIFLSCLPIISSNSATRYATTSGRKK